MRKSGELLVGTLITISASCDHEVTSNEHHIVSGLAFLKASVSLFLGGKTFRLDNKVSVYIMHSYMYAGFYTLLRQPGEPTSPDMCECFMNIKYSVCVYL